MALYRKGLWAFLGGSLIVLMMAAFATASLADDAKPCAPEDAKALAPTISSGSISLDKGAWQPMGGNLTIRITGVPQPAGKAMKFAKVYFRADPNGAWLCSTAVRRLPDAKAEDIVISAQVPGGLLDSANLRRNVATLWLAAEADLRVVLQDDSNGQPIVLEAPPIAISSIWLSTAVAVLAVLLTWVFLNEVRKARNFPAGPNWILSVISDGVGRASLSQFQILLWVFVLGASAVYVMILSGSLLAIPNYTLALLGISGVSAAGAKLNALNQSGSSSASGVPRPGPITDLVVVGSPTDSEVRLTWSPLSGVPVDYYKITWTPAGGAPGDTIEETVDGPPHRLVRLAAGTKYTITVSAFNSTGPGPAGTVDAETLPTPPAPSTITQFRVTDDLAKDHISVAWSGTDPVLLQYRRHYGDEDWRKVTVCCKQVTAVVTGLEPLTTYDLSIRSDAGGGTLGAPSILTVSTLGPRVPQWSDLVVSTVDEDEIDVTRVQMLFFTVTAAIFALLKVVNSWTVPDIPESFLLLMGLSNGVYLTSKFIRR